MPFLSPNQQRQSTEGISTEGVGVDGVVSERIFEIGEYLAKLQAVNIAQSYKQGRGCLVHFVRLANTL